MGRPRRSEKRRGRGARGERAKPRRGAPRGSGLDDARVIGALSARGRGGVTATRLLRTLGGDRHELRALRRVLNRLERDGRIERFENGWRVPRADGLLEAELIGASSAQRAQASRSEPKASEVHQVGERRPSGLRVRDDHGREYRVDDPGDAVPGDRVLIAPMRAGRAEVLTVLRGERDHWVGILRGHEKNRMVGIAPYRDDGDWWVRVARGDAGGARPGEVVSAVPAERRRKKSQREGAPWARVVERHGFPGDPDADFAAVVWRHRLAVEFPHDAIAQAEALRGPDARELAERTDLRDRAFVTIDPATARDHDDAVCVERTRGGWRLWVAIADVSRWVEPGSPIDREALRRGTSVYFPDRAIPMLPERLSGDVCSLRPDVDRLVLAVEMEFDERGERGRTRFLSAVMRSRARLSYEQAAAAIEQGGRLEPRSEPKASGGGPLHGSGDDGIEQAAMLRELAQLTRRLRERRRAEGSLDFELPSASITLDAQGHPIDVKPAPRNEAHRAIEDAMLAANRAVAEWLVEREIEAVHRIHESPAVPELVNLAGELVALGLLDGAAADDLPARELARALERAVGSPAERWIHQLALRTMRRARYSARSIPHYALGFERYLHFTSPIRRYPDLAVHRALKAALAGEPPALARGRAEAIAVRSSYRERVAMAAEREMEQIKCCVLLRDHVGELHEGTVTGLAPHGLYVTLDAWWVEGLVHVSRMPDYAELAENGRALVAGRLRYELGDRVNVRIASADPVTARIDFDLLQTRGRRRGSG